MSPKMGRPKSEKPKEIDLKVRIDDETNNRLLEYAKGKGLTKAEVVRQGLQKILSEK